MPFPLGATRGSQRDQAHMVGYWLRGKRGGGSGSLKFPQAGVGGGRRQRCPFDGPGGPSAAEGSALAGMGGDGFAASLAALGLLVVGGVFVGAHSDLWHTALLYPARPGIIDAR